MMRVAGVVVLLALVGVPSVALAERHKPITAGLLTVNPADIIAVYRPVEQQAAVVFVGRPGQAVQAILFRDGREATAVFDELWKNDELSKDLGDEVAEAPLTRMLPKGAERRLATLLVNVDRLLAIAWDSQSRVARVYLDKPIGTPLLEPNTGQEVAYLTVPNLRQQAETLIAAYKVASYTK